MTRDVRTGVFGELGCKAPCKVFTTANITLEGEQTINGVAVIEDDIVGVKDQVDTTENGVYICSTGEWQRAVWFDDELDVVPGTLVSSYEGNTAPQAIYMVQCDDNPIQFGTSEINFVLKVKGTSTGDKSVTLTGPVTGTSNESSPGVLTVATTITNDAVTTAKILDNNVTNAKLAQVATATFKGRTTAGTGNVEDLTATQATALLNTFIGDSGAGGVKGLVPPPTTGDADKFLKGDATWGANAVPDASTTVKGIVELLTDAELAAGTDTTRAATAAAIASLYPNIVIGSQNSISFPIKDGGAFKKFTIKSGVTGNLSSGNPGTTITFASAFTGGVTGASVAATTYTGVAEANNAIPSLTLSNIVLAVGGNTPQPYRWIVFGYDN